MLGMKKIKYWNVFLENFDEWQEAMVNLVENFAMQINNEANVSHFKSN